jgi:enoyl-CoA hydratase
MSDDTPHVKITRPTPHVLLIQMDRPDKRNAINNAMVLKIAHALAAANEDESVRCAVLAGVDSAFCAGADIAENSGSDGKASNHHRRVRAWSQIESFRKPIVAAVNGYCLGAGNEIALTCDMIVAGRNALFGQPEVKIGGIPGDGGTQRLPRKMSKGMAAYMLFTGEPIDAETALRHGHVIEVVDVARTLPRALEIASVIASRAPLAVVAAKRCLNDVYEHGLTSGVAFERNELWKLMGTPDAREGGRAFLEKRPPNFTGKSE